jgi:hypothetical protein
VVQRLQKISLRLVILSLILLFTILWAVLHFEVFRARYKHHTISDYLLEYRGHPPPPDVLHGFGTNAIPPLIVAINRQWPPAILDKTSFSIRETFLKLTTTESDFTKFLTATAWLTALRKEGFPVLEQLAEQREERVLNWVLQGCSSNELAIYSKQAANSTVRDEAGGVLFDYFINTNHGMPPSGIVRGPP